MTGSVGAVGMAGLTLGGGYGPLIGRFGLALDNLLDAEIVLADGRILAAGPDNEAELFWALRGGGGNFGVVTAMRHQLHELPSVRFGILLYPSSEARAVLQGCAEIAAAAPEELTVQVGFAGSPDGTLIFVAPTWSGRPEEGEARTAPLRQARQPAGRRRGGLVLWQDALGLRSLRRQRAAGDHGQLLAAGAGRRRHRCLHRGDGGRRLAGLRPHHP